MATSWRIENEGWQQSFDHKWEFEESFEWNVGGYWNQAFNERANTQANSTDNWTVKANTQAEATDGTWSIRTNTKPQTTTET